MGEVKYYLQGRVSMPAGAMCMCAVMVELELPRPPPTLWGMAGGGRGETMAIYLRSIGSCIHRERGGLVLAAAREDHAQIGSPDASRVSVGEQAALSSLPTAASRAGRRGACRRMLTQSAVEA